LFKRRIKDDSRRGFIWGSRPVQVGIREKEYNWGMQMSKYIGYLYENDIMQDIILYIEYTLIKNKSKIRNKR
jgi:hypothetical protein